MNRVSVCRLDDLRTILEQLVRAADTLRVDVCLNIAENARLVDFNTCYEGLRRTYQTATQIMINYSLPCLDLRVYLKDISRREPVGAPIIHYSLSRNNFLESLQRGQFAVVAIGGTFDRLHAGHKLMLSVAALLSSASVICGVTDDADMIAKKEYRDRIESFAIRSQRVRDFFESFAPAGIDLDIVKLTEPFGPTITRSDIGALVITPETQRGGEASMVLNFEIT